MYRKSMRSALEEARAYSAVNEVKVSKGGKTLSISKRDVGVYQAKGWSLQEANMKRILQALQDKLSDEGGAAGFDDLKKTAKSMGLNLTPAMLKDMPGIKQHRDGDYILEASKYLRYSDLLIQKGRMQRAGDKQGEKQTDIEIEKEKKKLNITDEFKLEEKFTKKDFDKNEDENDHTLNAVMLAKEFGSSKEIKDMEDIDKRHRQRGHINEPDYSKRNAIVKKYYPRLK